MMDALYLDGNRGQLFALYYPPAGNCQGQILIVPPFAEELNKTRPLLAEQARQLASNGYGVLLLDLYGCGDSQGELEQARWQDWLDDLKTGLTWLREQRKNVPISLLAVRLGCLLAAELAASPGLEYLRHILMWQPVIDGRTAMRQFLRLRTLRNLTDGSSDAENSELIEVAGYLLSPDLLQDIEQRQLQSQLPSRHISVDWLSLGLANTARLPGVEQVLSQWRDQGCQLNYHQIEASEFWLEQEPQPQPELHRITLKLLDRVHA